MPGSASALSVALQEGASNLYDPVCLRTVIETVRAHVPSWRVPAQSRYRQGDERCRLDPECIGDCDDYPNGRLTQSALEQRRVSAIAAVRTNSWL